MHEAFLAVCLLRDYPYTPECLACHENLLFVGTKQGLLLVFELAPKVLTHPHYFVPPLTSRAIQKKCIKLNFSTEGEATHTKDEDQTSAVNHPPPSFYTRARTSRTFGRKPILQLAAVSESQLLLALTEGQVNVFEIPNCQLINTVPMSKGVSTFAHLVCSKNTSYGVNNHFEIPKAALDRFATISPNETSVRVNPSQNLVYLRIAVVVKRHLYLWRWDDLNRKFIRPGGLADHLTPDWLPELTLSEVPRIMLFHSLSQLIVGYRSEYSVIELTTGDVRSIMSPGRNQLPLITHLPACFQIATPDPELFDVLKSDYPQDGSNLPSSSSSSSPHPFSPNNGQSGDNIIVPSTASSFNEVMGSNRQQQDRHHHAPVGLCKDDILYVMTELDVRSCSSQPIRWTTPPSHIYVYPPYLIGVRDESLEVRLADPCELVQQLAIPRVRALCHYGGRLYAATSSLPSGERTTSPQQSHLHLHSSPSVRKQSTPDQPTGNGNELWLILSANRSSLVQRLVQRKEFELAILLSTTSFWTGQNTIDTRQIATLHAYHLFQLQQFDRGLQLFTQKLIDPSQVLGLFPDLSNGVIDSDCQYPVGHTPFTSTQFSLAAEALITYLLTWRRLMRQALSYRRQRTTSTSSQLISQNGLKDVQVVCHPLVDTDSTTLTSSLRLLEIIDTCLLKCYLATNTARVAPLLRQPNSCQLDESERTLLQHYRYQDLVLLYQTHKLHSKALGLLRQVGLLRLERNGSQFVRMNPEEPTSPLIDPIHIDSGELDQLGQPKHLVDYLQQLGPSHFPLVASYADWIMRHYPAYWLRVFVGWERELFLSRTAQHIGEANASMFAYRGQVINYLEDKAVHLIIPFLERLIFTRFDANYDSEDDVDNESDGGAPQFVPQPKITDDSSSHTQVANCSKDVQQSTNVSDSLWPLPGWKRSKSVDPDSLPPIVRQPTDLDPVELHTRYAIALITRILSIKPSDKTFACRVTDEKPRWGPVARLRRRLFRFLNHPNARYSPVKLLEKCPPGDLFEERTLLLANLDQHEQALAIWIHVLNDWDRAVSHCIEVYQRACRRSLDEPFAILGNPSHVASNHQPGSGYSLSNPSTTIRKRLLSQQDHFTTLSHSPIRGGMGTPCNDAVDMDLRSDVERNIFFLLLRICLEPPNSESLGISSSTCPKLMIKSERALQVLHDFGDRTDVVKVMRLLEGIKLSDISDYLHASLILQENTRTHLVFFRNAAKSELIASRKGLLGNTKQHFLVSPAALCRSCRRRIGASAFVRHPSTGELEHYGCCQGLSAR